MRVLIMLLVTMFALQGLLAPDPVHAAPATPLFSSSIDDYADYDGQDTCDPAPKPGVVGFKDLLQLTFGVHTWGITRSCSTPGVSEHEEGRALDYHFDYYSEAERAQAEDLLTWLLNTDRFGNTHAMARRLGLMYIIWNRQIWESYRPFEGWQQYDGSNPHTDHIHFSFSWPGARAQTSWWTGTAIPLSPSAQLGDFDGDDKPDVATFANGLTISRNVSSTGAPARLPAQQIAGDWAAVREPVITDWDGDGKDDILGRLDGSLKVWLSTGVFTFAAPLDLATGELHLVPADFNGDGKLDLATLSADGDIISIAGKPVLIGMTPVQQLMPVDWDGDGKADLLGREGDTLLVWRAVEGGFAAKVAIGSTPLHRILVPADHNGDGKPDLAIVTADAGHVLFHRNTSTPGVPSMAAGEPVIGGWATQQQLMTGDFDGDGRADVVGRYGGVLQVWLSDSTDATWSFRSYIALTKRPSLVGDYAHR